MAQISGNTCDIITLLPLGLDCESINSSTPITNNGMVSLFVTGGTPPYTINWSNGAQGAYIYNLFPGNYTATVTDFYKDFTATTTCSVSYNQIYLDKFVNCENSSNILYYTAPLTATSTFIQNRVYNIQGQTGCWSYKGRVLTTGQTYYSFSATTTAGPYPNCYFCTEEEPIPFVPLKPSGLCMSVSSKIVPSLPPVVNKIQFTSASTINGQPSWTSVTPSYTIFYNNTTTKWEVAGWSFQGVPSQDNTGSSPLGNWTVYGSNTVTMSIDEGNCITSPIASVQATNASCSLVSDGTAFVTASNGTPPYQYSLNNVTYQSSNVFVGLGSGSYTAYVKDSANYTDSQSFTISNASSPTVYSVKIYEQPIASVTSNNLGKFSTVNHKWYIDVTPPLPTGKKITFTLNHSVKLVKASGKYQKTTVTPTLIHNITTGSTGGGNITGKTISTPTITSGVYECDRTTYETGYTISYNCVIIGNGGINGEIYKKITTPDVTVNGCPTYGEINDSLSINNLKFEVTNACDSYKLNGFIRFPLTRYGNVAIVATSSGGGVSS